VLEKIHQENKDLVVLGIDVGEDMDVVQKFIKENKVTYPILLAGQDRVVNDYDAHALPTVVIIDKNGSIRTYKTGYGTETETQLRAAVMDAAKPAQAVSSQQVSGPQVSGGIGTGSGTGGGGGGYRIGNGVSAPNVLYKVEPAYSEEARKAHMSGTVLLSVVVSAEGIPRDIKVLRSLGLGLDEKAVEAVRTWRFRPGMKDGNPVAVQSTIEVNFRLLDGPNAAPPPIAPVPSIAALSNINEPESEPQSAEEAYRRGTHLSRTRRADEGIAMLGKAVALKPDWAQAYIARARAQVQQKRYNEAIKDFDEAIRLDAKNASWFDGRGLAYSNSGRHARAIEDYTRAIELNPNGTPLFYNNRGWAYTELGQPEKAVADLTKAIQIGPDFSRAYENRGLAYMRLENWKLAIADYTAALQLSPSRWLYEKRAEAKRAGGDSAGAGEDLRRTAQMPLQQTRSPSSYFFGGRDGRTSRRLTSVRSGIRRSVITSWAMSSGAIFQSSPPPAPNSVATLPGMM
jgi:TonB family protein